MHDINCNITDPGLLTIEEQAQLYIATLNLGCTKQYKDNQTGCIEEICGVNSAEICNQSKPTIYLTGFAVIILMLLFTDTYSYRSSVDQPGDEVSPTVDDFTTSNLATDNTVIAQDLFQREYLAPLVLLLGYSKPHS